jgi:hypothetical protein
MISFWAGLYWMEWCKSSTQCVKNSVSIVVHAHEKVGPVGKGLHDITSIIVCDVRSTVHRGLADWLRLIGSLGVNATD